jgi:DNA polymerase III delta subunit
VNKLAYFVQADGRTEIDHPDIEECMAGTLRTDVFAMLDAISSGRKAEAMTLLENSFAGGENVFRLLSLFTGHFEIMLGWKELSPQGLSSAQITKALGERSEWRVNKLGGYARRIDEGQLKAALGLLYDIERNVKSGDIKGDDALRIFMAGLY